MSNFIWMKNEGQWAGLAPEAPARGAIGETQKTGDRRPGSDTELEIANGEGQNLGHPFSPIGELCGYRNSGKWEIVSEVWIRPWGTPWPEKLILHRPAAPLKSRTERAEVDGRQLKVEWEKEGFYTEFAESAEGTESIGPLR